MKACQQVTSKMSHSTNLISKHYQGMHSKQADQVLTLHVPKFYLRIHEKTKEKKQSKTKNIYRKEFSSLFFLFRCNIYLFFWVREKEQECMVGEYIRVKSKGSHASRRAW